MMVEVRSLTMSNLGKAWSGLSLFDKALWVKKGAVAKSLAVNKVKNRAPSGYNLFVADHSNRVRYDGGSASLTMSNLGKAWSGLSLFDKALWVKKSACIKKEWDAIHIKDVGVCVRSGYRVFIEDIVNHETYAGKNKKETLKNLKGIWKGLSKNEKAVWKEHGKVLVSDQSASHSNPETPTGFWEQSSPTLKPCKGFGEKVDENIDEKVEEKVEEKVDDSVEMSVSKVDDKSMVSELCSPTLKPCKGFGDKGMEYNLFLVRSRYEAITEMSRLARKTENDMLRDELTCAIIKFATYGPHRRLIQRKF